MRLARLGNREAFTGLVRRHQKALMNFFFRLGADVDGAEDCAQETFLRLFRSLDRYRPRAPFGAFLYTIARHSWVDRCRRAARHEAEPLDTLEQGSPGAGDGSRDDRLDLRQALAALPEHLRMVVILSVDQGLSYAEIAAVLEIPLGTVKSRMHFAIRRLQEALNARTIR